MRCPHCGKEIAQHRQLPRGQAAGDTGCPENAPIVAVAVTLASGRYEGEARLIDPRGPYLIVAFPWKGNPWHRCHIAESEIVREKTATEVLDLLTGRG